MPVTPTYDLIASNVLSSSASSVTFSSIPATYRDLVLVCDLGGAGNVLPYIQFNSDTGENYNLVRAGGNGSSALSSQSAGATQIPLYFQGYATSTSRSIILTSVLDYSATDKHKPVLARSNGASNGTDMIAGRWANTAAINAIFIGNFGVDFASGSSFHLYGIAS